MTSEYPTEPPIQTATSPGKIPQTEDEKRWAEIMDRALGGSMLEPEDK